MNNAVFSDISNDVYKVWYGKFLQHSNISVPKSLFTDISNFKMKQYYPVVEFTMDLTELTDKGYITYWYVEPIINKLCETLLYVNKPFSSVVKHVDFIDYEQAYEYTSFINKEESLIRDLHIQRKTEDLPIATIKIDNARAKDFSIVAKVVIAIDGDTAHKIMWKDGSVHYYIQEDSKETGEYVYTSGCNLHITDDFTYENLSELSVDMIVDRLFYQVQLEGDHII